MTRNPAANCGNCPYWASWIGTGSPDHIGECRQTSVKPNDKNQRWETTGANEWCGQHPDFWETVEVTETIPTVWPDTGSLYKLTSVNKKLNAGEMDLLMSDLNTLKNAILAFIEKHDEPKVTINHTAFTSTIKSHKYPEGTE